MNSELETLTGSELATTGIIEPERNPAISFLMGKKATTRRAYQGALNLITDIVSGQSPQAPKRPRKPVGKATADQIAEYDAAVLGYGLDRVAYHNRFLDYDWSKMRVSHVKAILAKLQETAGKATINRALAVIKGVMGESFDLGYISGDDLKKVERIKGVKPKKLPSGRYVPEGERIALFAACMRDQSASGTRDAAIFSLGFIAALRRTSFIQLNLSDYDRETGELTLLHTKGDSENEVYITNGGKDAVDDWLTIRGDAPGPLFWHIGKGDRLSPGSRLTPQGIYHIVAKRCEEAKIKPFHPHDLRRSAITDLIDRCGIAIASKIAGHANIATTQRYNMSGKRAKLEAAQTLTVPYTRRTLDLDGEGA